LCVLCLLGLLAIGPDVQSAKARNVRSVTPQASTGAPLTSSPVQASEAAEDEGGSAEAAADPLVSNGLGSPSCHTATAGELSPADRRHCETSGFVAASAPTGNYGIDVHIDSGVFNIGANWLYSVVQDVFIGPVWMGLVWAVHAVVVMLEWSFTIDLLPSAAAGGLGKGLRQMQATFTQPWLPVVLAVASVVVLYRGVIRRRVAETVGEALLMAGMMLAGLWVIADPQGTLGPLGGWANEAALGTLAVASQGSPAHPARTFAANLDTVFASAIEGPWCYLEFGNVGWCREPQRLDPRLRAAGLRIAKDELEQIGCADSSTASSMPCVPDGGEAAKALEHSATMLRFARSNGAIFQAVPPNGKARNSINDQGSLLRAICQSSDATNCNGSSAAEAQFRTGSQTWSRLGGLLLIVGGSVGMLLLFGFLTLRLLAAALFSLLYLLLAPAMVLAPAFGEGGRALFRRWGLQLLGSALTKLVFSFLLGVVLALVGAIASMSALGWWTQWLLMSVFWWGAYMRRHHALGLAAGVTGATGVARPQQGTLGRWMGAELETRRRMVAERRAERKRAKQRAPDVEPRPPAKTDPRPSGSIEDKGGDGSREGREERSRRLEEVESSSGQATSTGATTGPGAQRDSGQEEAPHISRHLSGPADGDIAPSASQPPREEASHARSDGAPASEGRGEFQRVNMTTSGPEGSRDGGREEPRDYAVLASLVGYSRAQYGRLDPTRQREAREAIDRELATRGEMPGSLKSPGVDRPPRAEHAAGTKDSERPEAGSQARQPRRAGKPRSDVMRDARDVEAGRKRQLGPGRP
jgi:hypothetical protein